MLDTFLRLLRPGDSITAHDISASTLERQPLQACSDGWWIFNCSVVRSQIRLIGFVLALDLGCGGL